MEEIYEPLNNSLQHVGSLMDAAEAHGILCGLLCTSQPFELDMWFRHVFGETAVEDGLASECQQQLLLVKNYTLEQLNSPQFQFVPLLPGDDILLSERVQALGGWCEGFLFGVGLAGIEIESLPDDAKEFINDVLSVSRVALADESEENEDDYIQVFEYIRIGVISFYEEMSQTDGEYGQQ
ncbi:MAG: hypothetical protein DRR08_15485 [Candidatus Parabeggiatoa sp. nov. 2]|nr:MAG: hypothetical protein B6247_21810 [Beggiatoa sp. 4572_84]RKZ58788.1 MAG: hypothetical protein DRR08_15485 [Gammaproteobacteria bacterium]HEC84593.1 YecA family protein [Thioploca sp.]